MSDLAATHCGNDCDCRNNNNSCNLIFLILLINCICGNNGCGNGWFGDMGNCSWLWIILLLGCGCGNWNMGCGC